VAVQSELRPTVAALGRAWLAGTVLLTLGAFAVTIALAPPAGAPPGRALQWLLFVGSSVHVATTAWFLTVREVRAHARAHPQRYVVAPIALVGAAAVVAALVPSAASTWLLLAFFAWQFFHIQKQNVGMVALAGVSHGVGSAGRAERIAIMAAGLAGITGLLANPELLQLSVDPHLRLLFPLAACGFAIAVAGGIVVLWQRPAPSRPVAFVAVYLASLLFFAPVFVFQSPYAAVAGITIAHGYQYLLIMGLLAGARRPGRSTLVSLAVLVNLGLVGGAALNLASHLHSGGPAGRAVFGAYLGLVMTHFVIDAGLWRLRDEFPRTFLTERLPYLLGSARPADRSRAG
jgi:hypothetical protein